MISYQLLCDTDHRFTVWFQTYDDSVKQLENHLVTCPVCGSNEIDRKITAVSISKSTSKNTDTLARKEMKKAINIAFLRTHLFNVIENAEDVGDSLVDVMDSMTNEEIPKKNIKGSVKPESMDAFLEKISTPKIQDQFVVLPIMNKTKKKYN